MNEKQVACKDYKNYKGKRRPKCACVLCREKYIDTLVKKLSEARRGE